MASTTDLNGSVLRALVGLKNRSGRIALHIGSMPHSRSRIIPTLDAHQHTRTI